MASKNESTQLYADNTVDRSSRESLIQPNQHEVILKVPDLEEKPICRICYSGSSKERLLKPCKCKGTIGFVHRCCLERWLETKNFETCELCHHHFETKRTRKSCWEWLRQPEMQTERRNFIGDCTCFAFLTPLGIATFWLCAEGAVYYQRVKASTLETVALVTLAIFLVVAYFTWVILCTRYHFVMWSRWRDHNWNVRIVDREASSSGSNSDTTLELSSDSTQPQEHQGPFVSQNQLLKSYPPSESSASTAAPIILSSETGSPPSTASSSADKV